MRDDPVLHRLSDRRFAEVAASGSNYKDADMRRQIGLALNLHPQDSLDLMELGCIGDRATAARSVA